MGSQASFVEFILDQLSTCEDVVAKKCLANMRCICPEKCLR